MSHPDNSGAPSGVERISPRVLVVDDDATLLRSHARLLQHKGYAVTLAADGQAAVDALRSGMFDAILSDIQMPNMNGLELLETVRKVDLDVPVILMTGDPSVET